MQTPFHRRALSSLSGSPFFGLLSALELEAIARHFRPVVLVRGQELFHKGDPPDQLYGVLSGCIKVYASHPDGRDVAFSFLGPGDIVGELGVADSVARSASVLAVQPCELASVARGAIVTLIERYPGIGRALSATSTETVRRLSRRTEEAAFLSLEARLASTLLELAERFGEPDDAGRRLRFRQQDLADLLAASRESVNKHLRIWEQAGWLELRRGALVLHQEAPLAALRESSRG